MYSARRTPPDTIGDVNNPGQYIAYDRVIYLAQCEVIITSAAPAVATRMRTRATVGSRSISRLLTRDRG